MEVLTGCPYHCGGSCPLKVYVEGGEIKRIGPYEEPESPGRFHLRPCAGGLAQVQRVYHPERLELLGRLSAKQGIGASRKKRLEERLAVVLNLYPWLMVPGRFLEVTRSAHITPPIAFPGIATSPGQPCGGRMNALRVLPRQSR